MSPRKEYIDMVEIHVERATIAEKLTYLGVNRRCKRSIVTSCTIF